MLQEFWRCFMTTGRIDTYILFKEYEREYYCHSAANEPPKQDINEVG